MRDSTVFYRSFFEAVKELPAEQFKACVSAIMEYALDGKEPESSGIEKTVYLMAKPQIDRGNYILDGQNGRHSGEYANWRKAVFERDKYTCQLCMNKGGVLNAHHIKRYSDFPQFRYDVDNGVTLCKRCHRKVYKNEK